MNHARAFPLQRLSRLLPVILLAFALLCAPFAVPPARAAAYDEAMEKLNEWGVINGFSDGELHPERYLTRAQFVAMINRAYGYHDVGPIPFRDVLPGSWYYDDIAIAYNMGYFTGTSANTASPDSLLSRQQAMTLLAKNLRLDSIPGEVTQFTDGNGFAAYSKGYVRSALQKGLINGYEDGSFRPEEYITRGSMAMMLYRALGHLVQDEGTYELGDLYGNVTVSAPNTTLRNSTIGGDLYLTGGLGLGGTTLENVRVLGNIVVAGTGESESGNDSVVLRNVEADNLQIDSLKSQYLSLRAEGTTDIDSTTVRSDAFIMDRTATGQGLRSITLEGASGNQFTLTGNVENVVNKTPNAALRMASGTLQSLTMDEEGAGSSLVIDENGTVNNLNLDTGTPVTGAGDVDSVTINTTGSTVSMLPDTIDIRPGITSTVSGTNMNTARGQEASESPRLLAGYPKVDNIAPTTCRLVFSANKSGTVYWAVSGVTDGSVEEEALINPPAYGGKALANGNLRITAGNQEFRANVTKLTTGGSYYVAAVMVDDRGTRSPVKVGSFTTPDSTVPNFSPSYPSISANTYDRASVASDRFSAQVMVMANKTCQLYWALYNENSATPTPQDFRADSLAGSLASGIQDLTRSLPSLVQLTGLRELTTYDVYLWLTDADFAKSSGVRKLTFTTVDGTPPQFVMPLTVSNIRATSIGFTVTVNENATVYWVAVRAGTNYPLPQRGEDVVTPEYAQLQISTGMNAVKSGSVSARANTPANFTVTGLQAQTAYDVWYLARDTSGNYSVYPPGDLDNPNDPLNPRNVCMITANTLDNIPPSVKQEFTRYPEGSEDSPYADTNIRIVFSENVQRATTNERFLDLYQAVASATTEADRIEAREALAECLRNTIKLWDRTNPGLPVQVRERNLENENLNAAWVIDYRNATVTQEDTLIVVTFPTVVENASTGKVSALNLSSDTSYYFEIEDVADTSSAQNRISGVLRLDRFRTIASQVALQTLSLAAENYPEGVADIDMSFSATPISTAQADPATAWDMVIWSDMSCEFEMYVRSRNADSAEYDTDATTDANGWKRVQNPEDGSGGTAIIIVRSDSDDQNRAGQSLHFNLYNLGVGKTPTLRELEDNRVYEYGVRFLSVNGSDDRTGWSEEVHFDVAIISGTSSELGNLAASATKARFLNARDEQQVLSELSTPRNLGFHLTKMFLDTAPPTFTYGRPIFSPGDVNVEMRLQISRVGTVYYVIAPADGTIATRDLEGLAVTWDRQEEVPDSGSAIKLDAAGNAVLDENGQEQSLAPFYVSAPPYLEIVNPEYDNPEIKTGMTSITSGTVAVTVNGLIPETDYFAYFVLQGRGQTYSRYAEIYRFTTTEVQRPVITLDLGNPIVNVSVNREATVDFMVVNYNSTALSNLLSRNFWNNDPSGGMAPPSAYRNYASITNVLQALATNLASTDDDGQGSVFDKYATQTFKDQVAEYIRASSSNTAGTIIGVGHGIHIQPNERYVQNCSEYPMSERAQYAFLAVGRSPSGSGDAFRGIYPLTLVDSDAPKVTAVQSTLNMDVVDGQVQQTCSGRVSLTFNEYLFHSDDTTAPPTLQQVDRGSIISDNRLPGARYENFISIGSLVQSESNSSEVGLMLTDSEVGHQTLTIDFNFDHAQNGAFITFTSDLCDQYSNVRAAPLTVAIEITRVRTIVDVDPQTGDPLYGYISTPAVTITTEWDARQ